MSTYIYAITAGDHPARLDGLEAVGASGSLRTVAGRSQKAVVSDAPPELRAKRRDLVAHQAVLERLLEDGSALPMRFGLVAPDEQAVVAALDENTEGYAQSLEQLHGRVEYNLKATRDQDDLLREIVAESEEVRQLNEATRENPAAQDNKVALGELIAREVEQREGREAGALVDALAPAAVGNVPGAPVDGHFVNVSFLVDRTRAKDFTDVVQAEADRRGAAYELKLNGPLPPYSFV
ncbi:GvpL/GvpF family gas vesicle protein [Streptomyces meridianus]|uniref:GvpL/GvpF family gas vesicle protein n=1 Tax=Streptomyces meridianus TaxID=2938945 RepID=A0ABT0XC71_9ACTN|nr:GvpL/GvpF family gas vesicle protein [Streptomyces meridianus]MCM2580111.1 GvpL/GvpF family gas vesicle protein [Streptomyces meridianus]